MMEASGSISDEGPGMDLGVLILMTAAVGTVGWFFLGMQWNVHKGQRLLRWMRGGLPLIGERTTLQWVGTSLVRLGLREAKAPFREVEILLVFEPRDVPLWWLFTRWRGRRDLMIVRARLRQAPAFEGEWGNPAMWTGREILGRLAWQEWENLELAGGRLAYRGSIAPQVIAECLQDLARTYPYVARLSVRRGEPHHLQVHVGFPPDRRLEAREAFQQLRRIAEKVTRAAVA